MEMTKRRVSVCILLILFLASFGPSFGDISSQRDQVLAGERFSDQYFRPPPSTAEAVLILGNVLGLNADMKSGTPLFRVGAWYQLYIQSEATLKLLGGGELESGSPARISLEQLWHSAAVAMKTAGITPGELGSLTSDPDTKKFNTDPDPQDWKRAGAD